MRHPAPFARRPVAPALAALIAVLIGHTQPAPLRTINNYKKNSELFPIHLADVRFRLKIARPIPDSATKAAGMPMMLPHLMVFSKRVDVAGQFFLFHLQLNIDLGHLPSSRSLSKFHLLLGRQDEALLTLLLLAFDSSFTFCRVFSCRSVLELLDLWPGNFASALASISLMRVKGRSRHLRGCGH